MRFAFDLPPELESVQRRIREIIEDVAQDQRPRTRAAMLAVDIYRDDQKFYIEIDVPGVAREDISVELVGESVVEVSGVRTTAMDAERRTVSTERVHGSFKRLIELPEDVEIDPEGVQAKLRDGVLYIELACKSAGPRRTVEVG